MLPLLPCLIQMCLVSGCELWHSRLKLHRAYNIRWDMQRQLILRDFAFQSYTKKHIWGKSDCMQCKSPHSRWPEKAEQKETGRRSRSVIDWGSHEKLLTPGSPPKWLSVWIHQDGSSFCGNKLYGINWTWKHGARFYLVVLPSLWSTLSLAVGIVAKHAWLAWPPLWPNPRRSLPVPDKNHLKSTETIWNSQVTSC